MRTIASFVLGFALLGGAGTAASHEAASVNELRPDLFSSDEETAEGVALALKPLLGK